MDKKPPLQMTVYERPRSVIHLPNCEGLSGRACTDQGRLLPEKENKNINRHKNKPITDRQTDN
jgi:hypothetical protein